MNNSELKETIKTYFLKLEEESLNIVIKHSSYLKSNKGEKLILERKRHHYFYLIVEGVLSLIMQKNLKKFVPGLPLKTNL